MEISKEFASKFQVVSTGFYNVVSRVFHLSLKGFSTVYELRFKSDSGAFRLSLERDFKGIRWKF